MKIIDLSVTISTDIKEPLPTTIEYEKHEDGARKMGAKLFGGAAPGMFLEDKGPAGEVLTVTGHTGTHIDAPWHYFPTSEGKPSRTIDEMPLDWFHRPGVKLDFRHFDDGYVATAADVEQELDRIGYQLEPLDIVVMNTAAGAKFGTPEYAHSGCGFGREATLWLCDRGVRVVGTDAWSWDAPYDYVVKRYDRDHDASIIWEGHKAGRHTEYCQIEKLRHLDQLPAHGFTIACFPVKIHAASAGWTRAVAMFDDTTNGAPR